MKQVHAVWAAKAASILVLSACAESLAQPGAPGEEAPVMSAPVPVPEQYKRQIRQNTDNFLKTKVEELYTYNPAGIVKREDVSRMQAAQLAKARADNLARFLTFDVNGDGTVTHAEFDSVPPSNQTRNRGDIGLALVRSDSNGNGQLEFRELSVIATNEAEARLSRGMLDNNPMMFDLDGNGSVDVKELTAAVTAIAAEPAPEPGRPAAASPGKKPEACKFTAPSEKAEMLIVSGYEGPALSSVAANGIENETTVATIRIDKGTAPLVLFVTAHDPIIWKFEGATKRVERVIVQPFTATKGPGAGVVGIDARKVEFISTQACGSFATKTLENNAVTLMRNISDATADKPGKLFAYYTLNTVGLPSGDVQEDAKSGPQGPTVIVGDKKYLLNDGKPVLVESGTFKSVEEEFRRFHPGGVVQFNVKDVVAAAPVQAYEVLPQQAGLIQLLKAGNLSLGADGAFVIEKPFPYFPAGLNGAHSVSFVLKQGVEMPGGSPGHSSVVREDTGECVSRICR